MAYMKKKISIILIRKTLVIIYDQLLYATFIIINYQKKVQTSH
jgi:hypothetical protein